MSSGILLCLFFFLFVGCTNGQHTEKDGAVALLKIDNPATVGLQNTVATMKLPPDALDIKWNSISLWNGTVNIPFETKDLNKDGKPEELLIEITLPARSSVTLEARKSATAPELKKKTHAELSVKEGGSWKDRVYEGGSFKGISKLSVPPEHTDHSFYIRYEGPGWESEKVGYRFYLDWRNAIDIFGKTKNEVILDQVGLDGFDSYHDMSDWGMDVLKVGEALGLGALGCWNNGKVLRVSQTDSLYCEIPRDGNLESSVKTKYFGWSTPYGKTDVVSELTIHAGDRKTKHSVVIDPAIDSVCTGIVKHPGTELITGGNPGGWQYLATWGNQSLAEDNLGMAVFYHSNDLVRLEEDKFNHVVLLDSGPGGNLDYYFAACWEQEPGGIKTKSQFERYLKETTEKLDMPPTCEMK